MAVRKPTKHVLEAMRVLSERDPVFAAHIALHGPCQLRPRGDGRTHFQSLARSIAYQQLAGPAASTIWGRVEALVDGPLTPEQILALPEEQLRSAGLSRNKTLSLQDLAAHVLDGRLPLERIARQNDETVIEELINVRGIGRWTAEMFLMSQLGRLDVWPIGDLGVRNGFRRLYGLAELPTVKQLDVLGQRFAPFRSVGAWYCWRAADTVVAGDTRATAVKATGLKATAVKATAKAAKSTGVKATARATAVKSTGVKATARATAVKATGVKARAVKSTATAAKSTGVTPKGVKTK